MLILAYLIEDVIVLQTLNANRKRDIQATLMQHGNELIEFSEYFLDLPNSISSCLYALTMFATFLPVEIFFSTKIIHRIVVLLNSTTHRMKAAEFLSVIADRRGKYEERLGLLELFPHLFQASSPFNELFSSIQIQQPAEIYDFMKQYAIVLTTLSDQLCYLCGNEDQNKRAALPEQFSNGQFFQVLLSLMQHPSIFISIYGYQMWLQLVKANLFRENDYQTILPLVLRALCHSLVKLPYKKTDSEHGQMIFFHFSNVFFSLDRFLLDIAAYYIRYDFEDEIDYQKFLGKNRSILIRSINSVCQMNSYLAVPIRIGFDYADFCFQPVHQGNLLLIDSLVSYWQVIEKHLRPLLKPNFSFNHDEILSQIDVQSFCHRGQTLIELLLTINVEENFEFLAYSLRLITCLYIFTRGESTWTQRILGHLFRVITTERTDFSKSIALQKQASCLIDLCLNYGHVIFIYFNDLFKVTLDLVRQQTSMDYQQPGKLAGWQWSILVECLGILLNYSKSFQDSARLIDQLIQPFAQILAQFDAQVNDPSTFMNYLGFNGVFTPECKFNSILFSFLDLNIVFRQVQIVRKQRFDETSFLFIH